jgi:glycosyltransferase involved in cell wall biosynthesis
VVVAQNLVYHRDEQNEFSGGRRVERAVSAAQAAYYRRRMSGAYRRGAAVVAVSAETARVLSERAGLDLSRTTVVHEGADSFLLPEQGRRARRRRILTVSTLAPYKNLETTLELFARLRSDDPELSLELVGGDWRGFRAVLERRAQELGITRAVRFRGAVSTEELAELYASSTLLLSLSTCESFGLPLVEAMRYDLPVAAAARSSLPETAGGAALLVDPDDVPGMLEAVGNLLDDDDALAELSRRGRERTSNLTWSETARRIAEIVAGARRGSR